MHCYNCGDEITEETSWQTHTNELICKCCYENNYTYCSSCEELFHNYDILYCDNDDNYYCDNCYPSTSINDYHVYDEPFMFHSSNHEPQREPDENEIYLGTEVEIENITRDYDNDELSKDAENMLPVQCTQDGSLHHGFEMVSHPHTFEAHVQRREEYYRGFSYLVNHGMRGDETSTCGLHIHVSRAPLKEDTPEKIILFLENYKDEMIKFARRGSTHYAQYLSEYVRDNTYVKSLKFIKNNKSSSRYMVLNLTNTHTIEFRLFKSTLNIETYMATLNLVDNIVKVCNTIPLNKITWEKVVNYNLTDDLRNYLERRGLLTTETVFVDTTREYNEYLKKTMRFKSIVERECGKVLSKLAKKCLKDKSLTYTFDRIVENYSAVRDAKTLERAQDLLRTYFDSNDYEREVCTNVYNSWEK